MVSSHWWPRVKSSATSVNSHPPSTIFYTVLSKSAVALLVTTQDSSNHFYWNRTSNDKTKKGWAFDFLKTTVISPLALQPTWCSNTTNATADYEYAQPTSFKPTLEHTSTPWTGKVPKERELPHMSHITESWQSITYGTINTTLYYTSPGTSTQGLMHPFPNSWLNTTIIAMH